MKKNIIISLIFIILAIIIFYTFLYVYISSSAKIMFIVDKVAKSIHMKQNFSQREIDFVFIGSSRTQNHISTNLFQKSGLKIYNYGRPAVGIDDFAYMVNQTIKLKPKYIVLNINILELTRDVEQPKFPTLYDYFFINQSLERNIRFSSINEWLSSEINLKEIIQQIMNKKNKEDVLDSLSKNNIDIYALDCEVTNYMGEPNRILYLCSNGDGFLVGNNLEKPKRHRIVKLPQLNINKLKFLNDLVEKIKTHGIIPILVLEPTMFNITYEFETQSLVNSLDVRIINNLNFNNQEDLLWMDKAHFNLKGREIYSMELINKIQQKLYTEHQNE